MSQTTRMTQNKYHESINKSKYTYKYGERAGDNFCYTRAWLYYYILIYSKYIYIYIKLYIGASVI